jgi:sulfonate dioxygenase
MSTLTETLPAQLNTLSLKAEPPSSKANEPRGVTGRPGPDYPYTRFLPSYDQNYKLPPLEPFDHVDPGHAALNDPEPRSFLNGSSITNLTPRFGTEVSGLQLSSFGEREKRYV